MSKERGEGVSEGVSNNKKQIERRLGSSLIPLIPLLEKKLGRSYLRGGGTIQILALGSKIVATHKSEILSLLDVPYIAGMRYLNFAGYFYFKHYNKPGPERQLAMFFCAIVAILYAINGGQIIYNKITE